MPICTRRSCGQEQSSPSACVYHPGSPVFHEGQKSWSCCKEVNKPVLDFDDFMKIKGCQTSDTHSSERLPVEIPKAKEDPGLMKGVSIGADGKEIYGATSSTSSSSTSNITQPMTSMSINPSNSAKPGSAAVANEPKKPAEIEQDPADVEPAQGAVCKRSGCGETFRGEKRNREEEKCVFHKGSAIFHEGSKVSLLLLGFSSRMIQKVRRSNAQQMYQIKRQKAYSEERPQARQLCRAEEGEPSQLPGLSRQMNFFPSKLIGPAVQDDSDPRSSLISCTRFSSDPPKSLLRAGHVVNAEF